MSQIGILNVGAGDTKLSFDPKNPAECIRAARIVKDMLRRGYALLVETGTGRDKKYRRVLDFDDKVYEYIIADFDPVEAAAADAQEDKDYGKSKQAQEGDAADSGGSGAPPAGKRGRGRPRRIPAAGASGIAVSRTAGG